MVIDLDESPEIEIAPEPAASSSAQVKRPPTNIPGTWKPHCPTCCRPLEGELTASSCNHVFHRDCLPADEAPCPKCQQPCVADRCLVLFGLVFDEADKSAIENLPEGAREAAAEICSFSREVDEHRRVAEGLRQRLDDAQVATEKQAARHKLAEKDRDKEKAKCQKSSDDLTKELEKKATLLTQIDRNREQSAVVEYLSMSSSSDCGADALAFLSKMATTMLDPAPLLTEITRLRDHHRASITKLQKEHVKISQQESRRRREIAETSRAVASHQSKLQRCEGTEESLPAEKRPRLAA